MAVVKARQALSELHLHYESVEPYPLAGLDAQPTGNPYEFFRVEKMAFRKHRVDGKLMLDKSTVMYNSRVTVSGIPDDAYRYMLGSRSAIEWIIDRYQMKADKASGIANDPNDWSHATSHLASRKLRSGVGGLLERSPCRPRLKQGGERNAITRSGGRAEHFRPGEPWTGTGFRHTHPEHQAHATEPPVSAEDLHCQPWTDVSQSGKRGQSGQSGRGVRAGCRTGTCHTSGLARQFGMESQVIAPPASPRLSLQHVL